MNKTKSPIADIDLSNVTDFELMCGIGKEYAEQIDQGRWVIGDLALLVVKEYGKDRIASFATNINVPKSRVREYRTVCGYYPKDARAEILERCPGLTYTHFRHAMKLDDMELSLQWLESAAREHWSTDQMLKHVIEAIDTDRTKPERLDSFEGTVQEAIRWLGSRQEDFTGELRVTISRIRGVELS